MNKTPRDLVILCNMQIGQHKQLNQINFSGNFVKLMICFKLHIEFCHSFRVHVFVSKIAEKGFIIIMNKYDQMESLIHTNYDPIIVSRAVQCAPS